MNNKSEFPEVKNTVLDQLLLRWSGAGDAEFRQYSARRLDLVKLIGGAHGVGLATTVTFLISKYAETAHHLVWVGKACWAIFGVGLTSVGLAYWVMYRIEAETEIVLFALRAGKDISDLKKARNTIESRSTAVARLVVFSLRSLMVGWTVVFFGALFL